MLELKDIHVHRGAVHVLNGVSINVVKGEVVCLVGRNGAGKTTIAETVIGYLPIRAGQVLLHDEEITDLAPFQRARRGIGYAPDYAGIFADLTVAENLMISELALAASGRSRDAVEAHILAIFPEIREFAHRPGRNLSGGQKKMVAIARSMALAPSLLLLDEAFEGLAPVVVSRFSDAVAKIKQMGVAVLMAESHLAAAARVADRIYAIDRGEIIFHGTAKDFRQNTEVLKIISG
jgi:branched-chain amino acid transport system ATP-binding protein